MHIHNIISTIATIIVIAIAIAITAIPTQAQFIVNQSYFQDPFMARDRSSGGQSGLPPPPPLPMKLNETYQELLKELSVSLPEPENKTAAEECNLWIFCGVINFFKGVAEGVSSFFSFIGSVVMAIVDFVSQLGGLTLVYLKLLILFVKNIGSAVIAIAASLGSMFLIAIGFITLVAPTILAWIPWIVAIAFLATLADAANRAYRSNSIFPLLNLFTMWYNFFKAIIGFFEKIFSTIVRIAQLISGFIARVI
jgi:hypothetical protein